MSLDILSCSHVSAELIDYLIGNGQQLDALQLAQSFNLMDKYTPLSLLRGYVDRAKENAQDIINMQAPRKSLVWTTSWEYYSGGINFYLFVLQCDSTPFNFINHKSNRKLIFCYT